LPFRKIFEKKFASQINELSEDVLVSNGVLILKKGCLYNKELLCDKFRQILSTIKYQKSNFKFSNGFNFFLHYFDI
jgi:hypothetical protein